MDGKEVSYLVEILRATAGNAPPGIDDKKKLYDAARELMLSVETPRETTHRVYYGVRGPLGVFSAHN